MTDIVEVSSGSVEIIEVASGTVEIIEIALQGPPGADGATDHGALTGLSNDDHPHYHNDTRGDLRYSLLAHDHDGDYEPSGTVATHEAAIDPHPGYALESSLGGAALLSVGTTAGTVAAGDDARFATGTTGDAFAASHPGGNQHIDWTADQGATNLHAGNIPDLSGTYAVTAHDHAATYAPIAKGVTNGDTHDHSGGDGAQIAYGGLSGLPTLGTAAATESTDYATAAQGSTADSAVQPGDDAADLGSGAATDGHVLTADGVGGAAWEAVPDAYAGAASEIHGATEKTAPVDADELGLVDSAASWVLKKLSWGSFVARIKTALTYFSDESGNFSIGSNSFANLTSGVSNTFIGSNAGQANTTGPSNSFIGYEAGYSNTTGYNNNFIGYQTGRNNTTGFYNNFMGYQAGRSNNSGSSNNFMGYQAGYSNTTGVNNTYMGMAAGYSGNTGYNNICIGYDAGRANTTGINNSFIGYRAGRYHADGSTALTDPDNSVYIGYIARGKDNADNNSVVIGGNTPIGLGANTTVIGTSATTLTRLYGNIATGVDSPSAAVHAVKTSEQLRLGYDATNYLSATVSSTGNLTLDATGGTIYTPDKIENTTAGEGIVLKSPDGTRYLITVANGGTLSIAAA